MQSKNSKRFVFQKEGRLSRISRHVRSSPAGCACDRKASLCSTAGAHAVVMLVRFLLVPAVLLLLTAPGSAEPDELVYKICFPKTDTAIKKFEECKNEDCGLEDPKPDYKEQPRIEKDLRYSFLGATDYGVLWASNNYRRIGPDRIRALLYVVPTITTKTIYLDKDAVTDQEIERVFYSSYQEYRYSVGDSEYGYKSGTVRYETKTRAKPRTVIKKEVSGGDPMLLMVDLHCSARKIKIYDNNTMYYRKDAGQSRKQDCVELLWEKPDEILPWQNVSSLTIELLTGFYCRSL